MILTVGVYGFRACIRWGGFEIILVMLRLSKE